MSVMWCRHDALVAHLHAAGGIPIFTSRAAVARTLFDFVIEMRPFTTSGALEQTILREYKIILFGLLI